MDVKIAGGMVFLVLGMLQSHQAVAADNYLYLRCEYMSKQTDPAPDASPEGGKFTSIFRISDNKIENWSEFSRVFFDPCKVNTLICKTNTRDGYIEKFITYRSNDFLHIVINRYKGTYSDLTFDSAEEVTTSTSSGTCSKIKTPELEQRKF